VTDWALWRDRIASAMDGSHQTIESLEAAIAGGLNHAWMADEACLIVDFQSYPGGARTAQVLWAAGELKPVLEELSKLEAWAKAAGFTEVLIEGRAAWARLLRGAGYEPWSVTIRKEL